MRRGNNSGDLASARRAAARPQTTAQAAPLREEHEERGGGEEAARSAHGRALAATSLMLLDALQHSVRQLGVRVPATAVGVAHRPAVFFLSKARFPQRVD